MAILYGANGHPFWSYGKVSHENQVKLVRDIGLGAYRVDLYDSLQTTRDKLAGLITYGAQYNVKIQPTIGQDPLSFADETAAFNAGQALGSVLAAQFTGMTWELGNEYDGLCIVNAGVTGALPEHYDDTNYAKCRGMIKGLRAGVKTADPTCKVAVDNAGWKHYGFMDRLAADGVVWDETHLHWYSEYGDITNVGGVEGGDPDHINMLQQMADFGKPIVIGEFNGRPNTLNAAQRGAWMVASMTQWNGLADQYNIVGANIYELMEIPTQPGDLAFYGIANEVGTLNDSGRAVYYFLNPPGATPVSLASPLATLRQGVQVGVPRSITITHARTLVDNLEAATTQEIAVKTGAYTATTADNRVRLVFDTASQVTLTLPATLPVTWECSVIQRGAGTVLFQTSGSGAIRSSRSHTRTAGQYSHAYATVLRNVGGSAAEFLLTGDTGI